MKDDREDFIDNAYDFGAMPSPLPLSEEQKKMAALMMAVNAAMIQFIAEGLMPVEQQLHFMAHLQDFANRIYTGEAVKLPGVVQTLKLDSKAGNLFAIATEDALHNGHETFLKFQKAMADLSEERKSQVKQEPTTNDKPTVH